MGNSISKVTYDRHHNISVTEEMVQEARSLFPKAVKMQDQAVAVLLHWFANMSKDAAHKMNGSLCFAGQDGEALKQCFAALNTCFGGLDVSEFDMKEYRDSAAAKAFLSDLKDSHGSGIIVFRNIMHAHPDAQTTIKQLVQARSIAKHKPYIPWNTNFWDERLDFSQVIFLGVHTPPIFSTQVQSSKQIVDKTRRALGAILFDDVVPFVLEAHYGGSSTSREDLFVHPSQSYPRLSAKRVQPDHASGSEPGAQAPKRKKVHNKTTTITSNSNNTHSQNPNSNNNESNNNTESTNTDSQVTTGSENATNSHNTSHSHNTTTSPSLSTVGNNLQNAEETDLCDQPFPIRENISVEPFVDGEPYFSRLYDILVSARKEILICGWQISQIYLKRPYMDNLNSDLFRVLEDASKRGVIVYLMLRNYDPLVCPNDHRGHKFVLERNQNIKVSLQHRIGSAKETAIYSHHQKFVIVDKKIAFIGGLDLTTSRWDTQKHPIVDIEGKLFPDDDYYHSGAKNISRDVHPRMGWHDVQLSVEGEIVWDLRNAFAQRWNARNPNEKVHPVPWEPSQPRASAISMCQAQVVRSITGASVGKDKAYVEKNVMQTYVDLVTSARTFLYIENQYFLEQEPMTLMNALCYRIKLAHEKKEPFVVAIVLPMLPDNGHVSSAPVKAILTMQRETINYVQANLKERGIVPDKYIRFYGLYQHAKLGENHVAAQIYVHSKVMINDTTAIVGSGNINARSTSGSGDSEIGVVIHSAEFCQKLAKELLSEHTGIPSFGDISTFMKGEMDKIAVENMYIYSQVFTCLSAKTAKEFVKEAPLYGRDDEGQLAQVKGHIVKYPLNMLFMDSQPTKLGRINPVRSISK